MRQTLINVGLGILGLGVGGAVAIWLFFKPQVDPDKFANPLPNTAAVEPAFTWETAPSQSLVGEILALSGETKFMGRIATEAAEIVLPKPVVQGESLITGSGGKLKFEFANVVVGEMDQASELELVQSLSQGWVAEQKGGKINYIKTGEVPVNIRCKMLLVWLVTGETEIARNAATQTITITAINGEVKVAFNSLNWVTQTLVLEEGEQYVFNERTRRGRVVAGR